MYEKLTLIYFLNEVFKSLFLQKLQKPSPQYKATFGNVSYQKVELLNNIFSLKNGLQI